MYVVTDTHLNLFEQALNYVQYISNKNFKPRY